MSATTDIERAAKILSASRRATALTGAGMSTPSGIPDFRSPGSGLWEKYDPMEVASIEAFRAHPAQFYEWLRPLAQKTAAAEPNVAHLALARLEDLGILKAVITQNIDGLDGRAGSKRVIELHGHFRTATCIECGRSAAAQPLVDAYLQHGTVPRCRFCGGAMKPDVVLFGETLPWPVVMEAEAQARRCDVMLIAGSSLEVVPAAEFPFIARNNGAKLIVVNLQPTPADRFAEVVMHADVVDVLPAIADLCATLRKKK